MFAMSLTLTPDVLDRTLETLAVRPLAAQIADHLRQNMADRDLNPGDVVPGEDRLATALGVDRKTVREALRELELEGLIVRSKGARTRVAIPPAQSLYDLSADPTTALVREPNTDGADYSVRQQEITKESATAQDAEYLQIKRGAPILRRRGVVHLFGEPLAIHRQAMIYRRAKGTSVEHNVTPWDGVIPELLAAGIELTWRTEWWRPRMPNRVERNLLGMKVTAPVEEGIRILYEDGKPVHASKMITPGDRLTLRVSGPLVPVPNPSQETVPD